MRICPNCLSWRVDEAVENVISYYHCSNCDWMGISQVEERLPLHLPHRFSWGQVIFFVVILALGHLIFTAIGPIKYPPLLSNIFTFPARSQTLGKIESKFIVTDTPAVRVPTTRAVPYLPAVSPAGTESRSLQPANKYQVIANSDSKLYHLPGMKYYQRIASHHRVFFPSEEVAQKAGYRKAPK